MSKRTILIGAGASIDAGVPASVELLEDVCESVRVSEPDLQSALDTALGGLRFAQPHSTIDVEQLYQILIGLSQRRSHFLAPFIGAWHEKVTLAEKLEPQQTAGRVVQALASDINQYQSHASRAGRLASVSSSNLQEFRHALQNALDAVRNERVDTFEMLATFVLTRVYERCRISEPDRVNYLIPLVQASGNQPLWIASLNYDNAIELAAEHTGLALDRGVHPSSRSIRFDPTSSLTLAKLHGSLDWWMSSPDGKLEITDLKKSVRKVPTLIFGAGTKLRVTGPYLDLLLAFRNQLEETEMLEICGYSFRDTHINYLIFGWLEADSKRTVKVSDPKLTYEKLAANFDSTLNEVLSEITHLGSSGTSSMVPSWYSDRFEIHLHTAVDWAAGAAAGN